MNSYSREIYRKETRFRSGISKGKGFQGVMKRHNYSGGPGSHGSTFNRAPGSIGASSYPIEGLEESEDARPYGL